MKTRQINAYIRVAEEFANLSYAERLKVGAIVVKDDRIISIGYNGTPAGWDNVCEHDIVDHAGELIRKTKPEVLHAEENAILKLAKSNEGGDGAVMFATHAPCINCARMIYGAGIKKVYYKNVYRSTEGIEFLNKCDIPTIKVENGT